MKRGIALSFAATLLQAIVLSAASQASAEDETGRFRLESAAAEAVHSLCRGPGDWSLQEQAFWQRHSVLALQCYEGPHIFPRVALAPDEEFVVLSSDTHRTWDDSEHRTGDRTSPAPDEVAKTAQQRWWDQMRAAEERARNGARTRFNEIARAEKLSLLEEQIPGYVAFFLSVFLTQGGDYLPDEATARRVAATYWSSPEAEPYLAIKSDQAFVSVSPTSDGFEGEAYAWIFWAGPVVRYSVSVTQSGLVTHFSTEWLGGQRTKKTEIH